MLRFGIVGRMALILLGALVAISAASMLVLQWQATHHTSPSPFRRIEQFAGDADLLAASPASLWPLELRALHGQRIWLALVEKPPSIDGLILAPRLEARMHAEAQTEVGRAARVFTSSDQLGRDPRDGVEGFMKMAYVRLPNGRYLVGRAIILPDGGATLLGMPGGLLVGLFGAAVAIVAVFLVSRELRPIRMLARLLDTFDGAAPVPLPPFSGPPDLQELIAVVIAMQQRVATLVSERTLMLGSVSHDLRTLLTRLKLRMEILLDETIRPRFVADLDTMGALIEDALSYARGTNVSVVRTRLDLSDIVATEAAEREAMADGLRIETRLEDGPVFGDHMALRRVVANLLDNAQRFGRTKVLAAVRRDGAWVHMTIEDDGPGVPPDQRAAVLLPFHRVEGSRSRETGGAGLGLTIASRIVIAHGGDLHIETSPLGGALVRAVLPFAD